MPKCGFGRFTSKTFYQFRVVGGDFKTSQISLKALAGLSSLEAFFRHTNFSS